MVIVIKGVAMTNYVSFFLLLLCYIGPPIVSAATKTKRQIYREQVLPHSGGKIPEEAFRADRLALNRLNKEGIAVPDGVLLEHRNVHSHPHEVRHDPEDEQSIVRIIQQAENRYTPAEGRYQNQNPLTVASTYIIRKPIGREETNIRPPDQQRPLHKSLTFGQRQRYNSPRQYNSPPPPTYQPKYASRGPTHRPTLPPFKPIPVPLELPNREIQNDQFYLTSNKRPYGQSQEPYRPPSDESYRDFSPNDITGDIDWQLLINSLDNLPNHLSNLVTPEYSGYHRYGQAPPTYQYFERYAEPEYALQYGGFYPTFGERYTRKSQEGFPVGSDKKISFEGGSRRSKGMRTRLTQLPFKMLPGTCNQLPGSAHKCQGAR